MKAVVCTVALGGWYPAGAARLIATMREHSPAIEVQAHVNTLPFGAPRAVIEDGYDYTAYCAKPFALAAAMMSGADIAILVDAAFFAVRDVHPLITHIARNGYYLCKNGNKVGTWCSDRAVPRLGMTREKLMEMEEVSSYCVGLNFADGRSVELLHRWCGFASDRVTFAGPHTSNFYDGRNLGFVSSDVRVRGHRHDQTALSVIANLMGMTGWCERPLFTSYAPGTEQTVLVNQGMA